MNQKKIMEKKIAQNQKSFKNKKCKKAYYIYHRLWNIVKWFEWLKLKTNKIGRKVTISREQIQNKEFLFYFWKIQFKIQDGN